MVGVLQIFSYFIKSCYHFINIKLLALVLVLLKQEYGESFYLLLFHAFKGCMFLFGSVHHLFKKLTSECIPMSFSSSMSSKFYVKNSFLVKRTNIYRTFISDFQIFIIKSLYSLLQKSSIVTKSFQPILFTVTCKHSI